MNVVLKKPVIIAWTRRLRNTYCSDRCYTAFLVDKSGLLCPISTCDAQRLKLPLVLIRDIVSDTSRSKMESDDIESQLNSELLIEQCDENGCIKDTVFKHLLTKFRESKKSPVVIMDFYLAWCCLQELTISRNFCRSFFFLFSKFLRLNADVIMLYVSNPVQYNIDSKWCYRLTSLLHQRHALEEASAWLSTLGGGFSSLGDYFHHHATVAGKISLQQWRLAIQLGDKALECRCKLFLSQSLMQQGHLRKAKHIIRCQFQVATNGRDDRLVLVCKAMWNRLKYLYSQRRLK